MFKQERHMTNEEIKLARKLRKSHGPNQMDRVRAARAIIEARNSERLKMAGFLAIFHPELDEVRRRELINSAPQ
jgi:hypothetical protein